MRHVLQKKIICWHRVTKKSILDNNIKHKITVIDFVISNSLDGVDLNRFTPIICFGIDFNVKKRLLN